MLLQESDKGIMHVVALAYTPNREESFRYRGIHTAFTVINTYTELSAFNFEYPDLDQVSALLPTSWDGANAHSTATMSHYYFMG